MTLSFKDYFYYYYWCNRAVIRKAVGQKKK